MRCLQERGSDRIATGERGPVEEVPFDRLVDAASLSLMAIKRSREEKYERESNEHELNTFHKKRIGALEVNQAGDQKRNDPDGTMATAMAIDEDLHSRQLAVYGRDTMRKMASAHVLVSGLRGLGVEIAKNLVLAGVRAVTLMDDSPVEAADLSSQFYFKDSDIGEPRARSCAAKLQELRDELLQLGDEPRLQAEA